MPTGTRSLHRSLVDEALAERGLDLPTYIAAGRSRGKSVTELHNDLTAITGVPFTSRTLYRWLEDLEEAS